LQPSLALMRNSAALTLVPNAAPDRVGLRRRGRSPRAGGVRRQCGVGRLLRVLSFVARARPLAGDRAGRRSRLRGWLPETGTRLYRPIRRLLGAVCTEATPGPVKIGVLDLVGGKSHVEVTVTFRAGRSWRVLSSSFPRCLPRELWLGFAEGIASELRVEDAGGGAGRPPAEVERASTGPAVGGSRTRRSAGGGSLVAEFGETHLRLPPRDSPLR